MTTALETFIAENGLSIRAEFVPFSKSRNATEKDDRGNPRRSLNWQITLVHNERDIMTTDYSAGIAHCPSYSKPVPSNWQGSKRSWQPTVCEWECENGFEAALQPFGHADFRRKAKPRTQADLDAYKKAEYFAIEPKAADVLCSLALDAGVLDYRSFEDWALEYGYEPDSRKAETIYRACMEIALQLRAGLGDRLMSALQEAAQDY